MASSPACRFYFADFDMDTADLSCEEVGAYMRLLSHQWEHEVVPKTMQKRARICRISARKMKTIWDEIGRFFVANEQGFLNERMEDERRKQAEYRRKQAEAGRKGGQSRGSSDPSSNPSSETQAESNLSFSGSDVEREKPLDPSLSTDPSTTPTTQAGVNW